MYPTQNATSSAIKELLTSILNPQQHPNFIFSLLTPENTCLSPPGLFGQNCSHSFRVLWCARLRPWVSIPAACAQSIWILHQTLSYPVGNRVFRRSAASTCGGFDRRKHNLAQPGRWSFSSPAGLEPTDIEAGICGESSRSAAWANSSCLTCQRCSLSPHRSSSLRYNRTPTSVYRQEAKIANNISNWGELSPVQETARLVPASDGALAPPVCWLRFIKTGSTV